MTLVVDAAVRSVMTLVVDAAVLTLVLDAAVMTLVVDAAAQIGDDVIR